MAIKVYGRSISPYVRTVLLALYEKNVEDFELVQVDQKSPEYLQLNPFGKIPCYQDGDFTIFESRAIIRYVAARFEGQGTPLQGSNLKEKAMIDQWMEVESQTFFPAILAICYELYVKPTVLNGERGQTDDAVVATNVEKLEKVLDIYEAQLAKSKYLAGDGYSLADLIHHTMISTLILKTDKGHLITSREHVSAWWESISARPAWKRVSQMGPLP